MINKKRVGFVPHSFMLFCQIGFLQLHFCAVVGKECEEENHEQAVNVVKDNKHTLTLHDVVNGCQESKTIDASANIKCKDQNYNHAHDIKGFIVYRAVTHVFDEQCTDDNDTEHND